ncbi:adenylate/guanylate cyclase domain-containing protein [Pseudonocardia spinosispora]|uniref:adenylate/guanylate cyclase domain-containing protein n=1 Tax=Pseudonocardia spinosispora TaxID=103441 RepID=UPI0003FD88F7|nr:adenylate/guanylate cyclase domain-containing protein [Pseudonocardia spinosispora]
MTTEDPARDRSWLSTLGRLLPGRSTRTAPAQDDLYQQAEALILGGPRKYSRTDLVATTGIEADYATRIWRSLGFAEVGDDDKVFTDGDLTALRNLMELRADGLVPDGLEETVARSVGLAMAGLANWQIDMIYQLVDYGHNDLTARQIIDIGDEVLPLLKEMQTYVWRRHLAAAAGRLLTGMPGQSDTRELVIGFADMVGFTRASRQLSPAELSALIEEFQNVTSDVVAHGHGRVVKTVGDEVLFVADQPADGAEIALTLLERLAESPTLPELRIGLAVGPVTSRFGDVYGEVVNIAARLTTNARPGRILVDRNLAAVLENDSRFHVRVRRPLAVRGYRHLQSWGLTRARNSDIRRQSTPESS